MARIEKHLAWAEVSSDDDCRVVFVYTQLDEVGALYRVEDQSEETLFVTGDRDLAFEWATEYVECEQ